MLYLMGTSTSVGLAFVVTAFTSGVPLRVPVAAAFSRFFSESFFSRCSRRTELRVGASGLSGEDIDGAWSFTIVANCAGDLACGSEDIGLSAMINWVDKRLQMW
jgi:hypothetical protein